MWDATFDYSTIDTAELARRCPPAKYRKGTRLDPHYGSGCAGDPPGYPSYFVRHVYTEYGNEPATGSTAVLMGRELETRTGPWREGRRAEIYAAIYRPLPFEHARVQAWIVSTFQHLATAYEDVERPEYDRPGMLFYPVPEWRLIGPTIKANHDNPDDPRYSDEYRAKIREARAIAVRDELARAERIAVPDNHLAARRVRKWYPEQDAAALLARYGDARAWEQAGAWWEREAARPASPEVCQPWPGYVVPKHQAGWCQYCGYVTESTPAGVR